MENVRRFAFAGERGGWIAFQKAPATSGGAGGGSAPPAGPGGASGSGAAAASDRPKGADLILRDLATGRDLNIGNVAEFAFDKSGRYLALVIDAPDKAGNGVQLRNMESGVVSVLDSDKASYERLAWTEKGDGLAVREGHRGQALHGQGLRGWSGSGTSAPRAARSAPSTTRPPTRRSRRACRSPVARRDVDGGPDGARVRHPDAEEIGCEARGEAGRGRRGPDGETRRASGPSRPGDARRGQGRSRPVAPQGPAPAVAAAGAGGDGQELQLPVRLPRQGEQVHPPGRRIGAQRDPRAEGQVTPSATTSASTSG